LLYQERILKQENHPLYGKECIHNNDPCFVAIIDKDVSNFSGKKVPQHQAHPKKQKKSRPYVSSSVISRLKNPSTVAAISRSVGLFEEDVTIEDIGGTKEIQIRVELFEVHFGLSNQGVFRLKMY
jgi:hypothetical protein